MTTANRQPFNRAFTQVELLAVLAALLIPAFLLFPSFPRTRCKASRIGCVNKLKQIGLAYRMWSNENDEKFPWAVSATNPNPGTLEIAETGPAWRHFQIVSNELTSPKVLVCPNDRKRSQVSGWQDFTNNKHLSYFVGLDSDERWPQTVLSGDRNLGTNGQFLSGLVVVPTNAPLNWNKSIHDGYGNIGLADGSVQQMTTQNSRRQFAEATNALMRLLIP